MERTATYSIPPRINPVKALSGLSYVCKQEGYKPIKIEFAE